MLFRNNWQNYKNVINVNNYKRHLEEKYQRHVLYLEVSCQRHYKLIQTTKILSVSLLFQNNVQNNKNAMNANNVITLSNYE